MLRPGISEAMAGLTNLLGSELPRPYQDYWNPYQIKMYRVKKGWIHFNLIQKPHERVINNPRINPALVRSWGSRGSWNFAWSKPSVQSMRIWAGGSHPSDCSVQMTVLSQYWSWRWDRYPWRQPSFCSKLSDLSWSWALKAQHTSQVVNNERARNRRMSRQRCLYTWWNVVYLIVVLKM